MVRGTARCWVKSPELPILSDAHVCRAPDIPGCYCWTHFCFRFPSYDFCSPPCQFTNVFADASTLETCTCCHTTA